jgi:hypothetical protein
MGQDTPDQDDLILEEYLDDQAILIPADVDQDQMADPIGTRAGRLELGDVGPSRLIGDPEPSPEWGFRVGMFREEFTQPPE